MKIFHVNASYKPAYIYGGPTMSISKLCEELVKAGNDVEVLTTTANGETELDVKPGVLVLVDGVPVNYFRRITKDPSHFSPALLFHLFNTLKRKASRHSVYTSSQYEIRNTQYPIVHIHAWWNLVSVGACIISLILSRPVILSPRGTLSNYSFGNRKSLAKNIFHQLIGKALLKRCHFHVSSEKEKQDILNITAPKSITVIPNFVKLLTTENIPVPKFQVDEETVFKLIFLSRIEEKKGLDILFRALKQIQIPWQLTIAGTGKLAYVSFLKSLAAHLSLTNRISWIGQQDNDSKFSILAGHDLLVLPSHDESFANVVIESLSVGTPVLITKNIGLVDYVLANNLGWVCSLDENKLAKGLIKAFVDSKNRDYIRKNAPLIVRRDYNDQLLINYYNQLYDSLIPRMSISNN